MGLARKISGMIAVALVAGTFFTANADAAERKLIAVMPISSSVSEDMSFAAKIMEEEMTSALYDSGAFTVLERRRLDNSLNEMALGMSGLVSPDTAVRTGRLAGAKYSLIANLSSANLDANPTAMIFGALVDGGESLAASMVGRVVLDYQIVDNETGEIIVSDSVGGRKVGNGQDQAIRRACADAADKAMVRLRELNPFAASVLDVASDTLYIDKGKHDGVHLGDKLRIVREGMPIMKDGRIIAVRENELGEVKVVEVAEEYSVCHITSGEGRITKGAIAKYRPRKK